ncbi:MAG: phosphatase PAP2 family protein [Betaproteobacteria bacterium]
MKIRRIHSVLTSLALLALTGCASVAPSTSAEELTDPQTGYIIGYLARNEVPNSLKFLPLPPATGSAALAADEATYQATRQLRDTPRWVMAVKDADLSFPNAARTFSCALDIDIAQEATPHLYTLLRRVRGDASRATDPAKHFYKRQRPYLAHGDTSCTPQHPLKAESYPSGHTSIGWAWALILSEIAPERAETILARGVAYADSRIVCGVHWKSDTDAGRVVGAAVVSRLHTKPEFNAQLALAHKEIEAARAAGKPSSLDCVAEAQALSGK